jgi:ArsR family transcriptional regulator
VSPSPRRASRPPRFDDAAALLKALGQPLRLRLVCGLSREPSTLSRIAAELECPLSTLALHLGILRRAGILAEERRGAEVYFSVRDERVGAVLRVFCGSGGGSEARSSAWAWRTLARDLQARRR